MKTLRCWNCQCTNPDACDDLQRMRALVVPLFSAAPARFHTRVPAAIFRFARRFEKEWKLSEIARLAAEFAIDMLDQRVMLDPSLPKAVRDEVRARVAARLYGKVADAILADPDSDPADREAARKFISKQAIKGETS